MVLPLSAGTRDANLTFNRGRFFQPTVKCEGIKNTIILYYKFYRSPHGGIMSSGHCVGYLWYTKLNVDHSAVPDALGKSYEPFASSRLAAKHPENSQFCPSWPSEDPY